MINFLKPLRFFKKFSKWKRKEAHVLSLIRCCSEDVPEDVPEYILCTKFYAINMLNKDFCKRCMYGERVTELKIEEEMTPMHTPLIHYKARTYSKGWYEVPPFPLTIAPDDPKCFEYR